MRFQKKGGIFGWLHGDAGTSTDSPVEEEMATRPQTIATTERSSVPARPRASSLMNTLYDKMKKPGRDKRHNSSSEENKWRVSLQPRRSATDASRSSVGFDGFVGTSQGGGTRHFRRDSRLRSASSSDAVASDAAVLTPGRLRSLSFATRTTAAELLTSSPSTSSGLQMDAFPMEQCLADPKLAAEFINAVLPGDEWLLALLYSVEEYECMLMTDPLPSLETQITTAIVIIDRFLTPATPRPQYDALEIMGKELKHVVTQFQLPEHSSGGSLPTVLPKILFDSVYTTVYDILRDAYDSQFRATREHRQLLSEAKQQEQMRWQREGQQLLVLTFDQVLESERCCTVFWVYLFRTSHHHRVSFIIDVKYKLRRLWSTTQNLPRGSTEAKEAYKRLVHELELLCHRYLSSKMASVALPMTSSLLVKLKDEICGDIRELRLCSESSGNPDLIRRLSRIIEKLDTMHTQTRAEFKRVSLERFTKFLASSLYRDFILHPISSSSMDCSRSEDLMHLLRVNRIPFNQTPAMPPNPPTLTQLLADLGPDHCEGAFHRVIAGLFAFQGIRLATLTGSEGVVSPRSSRLEYRHWYSSPDETEATRLTLCKSSEHFLLPDDACVVFPGRSLSLAASLPQLPLRHWRQDRLWRCVALWRRRKRHGRLTSHYPGRLRAFTFSTCR